MKLVMTLLLRDNDDIVEANLDFHYAQGVDFVIATDNNSADRTPEILKRYEADGRLRLIREPDDTYAQARWVTRMARLAATEHKADWVIHSDADEFWWPDRGNLKSTLERVPLRYGLIRAPRVNFLPIADAGEQPFHGQMLVRERESRNALGSPLLPKVCHRARRRITVEQGNHAAHGWFLNALPGPSPITILHFPLRSYAQFENKIVKGGAAFARNTELQPHVGATWRQLYSQHNQGKLVDYYRQQVLDDSARAKGLAEGTLVLDSRLHEFLTALGSPAEQNGQTIPSRQPIA